MKPNFLDELTANPDQTDAEENAPKDGIRKLRGFVVGPTLTRAELEKQFGGPQKIETIEFEGPDILGEITKTRI